MSALKHASVSSFEPLIPSDTGIEKSRLPELALELERQAAALSGKLSPVTAIVLEEHMRVINSYYSNLIEGNSTLPQDIRKAMNGEYSSDPSKRDLQLESLAHIKVQRELSKGNTPPLLSADCFSQIHRLFYEELPDTLRIVKGSHEETKLVTPGQFRQQDEEVEVGRHLPPTADDLSLFLNRFATAYKLEQHHGQKRVIAAMAAHHRFMWVHPFLDGNGRVGRLHTDLFLKAIGIGACGIWCLSRGLARNHHEYKAALARADFPRQGDRDGRGALSESHLIGFCEFMLTTAIDQVSFMDQLLDLHGMGQRIQHYIDDRNKGLIGGMGPIKPEAVRLLEKAFIYGEFPRADMDKISGLSNSVTRKLVRQLKEEGLLTETSSRSPLRWAIPEHAERFYLPELAPTR
ncbi:MAG: cell filamentation protein Fic [Moraxellaceae bacterium]|nr:MAG: cell filamentation protein Fic [Moraxellaceae bacterium]